MYNFTFFNCCTHVCINIIKTIKNKPTLVTKSNKIKTAICIMAVRAINKINNKFEVFLKILADENFKDISTFYKTLMNEFH